MTDTQLYTKISSLPVSLKNEVDDFIEFLTIKYNKISGKRKKRVSGLAKGLIFMKENFDDPIEGFVPYCK